MTHPQPPEEGKRSAHSVVYVIGSPGLPVVKIGRTSDLPARLATLRTMSPVPLEVLAVHPGGVELEGGLHRLFADQRSHGEWFVFNGDPVAEIAAVIESGAWRQHVREPRRQAVPKTPEQIEKANAAMLELDQLTREHAETGAVLEAARAELHDGIVAALRSGLFTPGEVAKLSPYDRNHIGRIARKAGIPPSRKPGTAAMEAHA